ncbi:hypothetical protein GCM10027343_41590 [Noviherbaspirillum agri]
MNKLIALCADLYWEQDRKCRFTQFKRMEACRDISAGAIEDALGKAPWDVPAMVSVSRGWSHLQELVVRHETFRDLEWSWCDAGSQRFVSVSGEPVFDANGTFTGYHGLMRDITAQKSEQEAFRRFRAAIDVCGDPIFLIDRHSMRIIDANATACRATGYTYDELLTKGPHDFLFAEPDEIERDFDEVIAAGPKGTIQETAARDRNGQSYVFELQRRAMRFEGRWVIVTSGRDVTRRKEAEEAAVRFGQMYAAISGTNEAILHARSPEELFNQVCAVAVRGGPIVSASVLVPNTSDSWASVAAVAGDGADTLRSVRISFDENQPEGRGLVGTAYRSQKACVINDFESDVRMQPWRTALGMERAAAGAAVPLVRDGQSAGVLLLYSRDRDAFDDEIVQLLSRMAEDIVFALDNFDREIERRVAVEALRASEEKHRSILANIEEAYYEVDLGGTLLMCNEAFCRMFGYRMDEVIGMNYSRCHRPEEVSHVFANFNEVFRTGRTKKGIDWELLHRNGTNIRCEGSIHLVRNDWGEPVGFRGMLRDVTARREMEAAIRESEERFRDLTELSSDWYWEQDARYRFVQINGDVQAKTGMAVGAYLGRTLWELPFDGVTVAQWMAHQRLLAEGKPFCEFVLKTCTGEQSPRYLSISGLPVRDASGRLLGYRGTGKDITERKVAEERIQHLASHDILTGLPNRMMFNQMLAFQVEQGRRYDRRFALMFIDLDHFKAINDSFGHGAGDLLLKEAARRLSASVRASDFVARLAGDEFVVIIPELGDSEQLRAIAQKVVTALRAPVMLADAMHKVTASVGVCVFPDDGQDEEALLRHADAAMYRVKHSSKDNFTFYLENG